MECKNYCLEKKDVFDTTLDMFNQAYNLYSRIKCEEIETDEVENVYTKADEFQQIEVSLNRKIDEVLKAMKTCEIHKFSKDIKLLENQKMKIKKLNESFKEQEERITEYLNENSDKYLSNRSSQVRSQTQSQRQTQRRDTQGLTQEEIDLDDNQKIKLIQTYLDDKNNFLNCSEEEMQAILDIKQQIKELMKLTEQQIDETDNQLQLIDSDLEESKKKIEKANSKMKSGALDLNTTNKIRYKMLLGTILGTLATFIPIPGMTLVGAVAGIKLAGKISKKERDYINNIGKKPKK